MPKNVKIAPDWAEKLQQEFDKPYFGTLTEFIRHEYSTQTVYPPGSEIFRAFDTCPFGQVRVVIVGQDPYHGPGQANGLCFSVRKGIPFPPSLVNILKEVSDDTGRPYPEDGDLVRWSLQGVLLLNATLTVRDGSPGSHQNRGWEQFTDAVIHLLATDKRDLVFMLWGSYAQRKGAIIDRSRHLVLEAPHPSPLAAYRGYFGCKHFTKANAWLIRNGQAPVDW